MNIVTLRTLKLRNLGLLAGSISILTGHFYFGPTANAHTAEAKLGQYGQNSEDFPAITSRDGNVFEVQIKQITEDNVDIYQREGPDAIGGIGDWFISNGTICGIVSDVEHEGEFSTKGGSLVDLGVCGKSDDHFSFTHDMINGSRKRVLNTESISVEQHEEVISLVVKGQSLGTSLLTRYYFDPDAPLQLQISKTYSKSGGDDFNFVSPLNFNLRSLEPFIFNSKDPTKNSGFKKEDFVKRGISAIRRAARLADTIILPAPKHTESPVSYGWHLRSAQRIEDKERIEVPFFMLADNDSTAMMILSDTFYLGKNTSLGLAQLAQIPLLDLDDGAKLETHEVVFVGEGGDVASITDQFFPNGQLIRGQLDTNDSAIHVYQENGAIMTHVRPDPLGRFAFKLPEGKYSLEATGYGGREYKLQFNSKGKNALGLGKIELSEAAKLSLPQGHPMRLVFVGLDGTPNPDFYGELSGSSVAYDNHIEAKPPISSIFLAGVETDRKQVDIAPGSYRVYSTKGPEHSLEFTDIELSKGDHKKLLIAIPRRVIETPNYIASDLHVHSGLSFDNAFAESERVRSFVAEHGEVMVASEHDLPTDYSPYIDALGVGKAIVSIPAVEATSILPTDLNPHTGGHANIFPFEPRPKEYRNGMIAHENKRLRDLIYATKQRHQDAAIQLNHPRQNGILAQKRLPNDWKDKIDDGNYLDHMGTAGYPYNAYKPLTNDQNVVLIEPHPETGTRDLDFDLIEILNPGGNDPDARRNAVRQDWLSFLLQGEKIVGTANSDSHTALEQVALPRTMVAISNDSVEEFDTTEFVANLKAGDAFGTTGPMIEITLGEAKMGQTFKGIRGNLRVNISKAPWINVHTLDVQVNGKSVAQHSLLDKVNQIIQIPIEFDRDSFVTVEVFGEAGESYTHIYPGQNPYAFSNPIFVEFDGDKIWTPPGLESIN